MLMPTVTSTDASRVALARCNPTNAQSTSCTGEAPGAGINLLIPNGQDHAYFDLVGVTSAFTDTRFYSPEGLYVDGNGLHIADRNNARVRLLNPSGSLLNTIAGTGNPSTVGGLGGSATSADIGRPQSVVKDSAGNLYIASQPDNGIGVILKVGTSGTITSPYSGSLSNPWQVAVYGTSLYIADFNNARVQTVSTSGVSMTTFASSSGVFGRISGVAVDPSNGDVYFSDYDSHIIYKQTQAGVRTVFAGTGTYGFNGDQATPTSAQLYNPQRLFIPSTGGVLYLADASNHRIRKITLPNGPIVTVAGTTSGGFSGDGDLPIVAQLNFPSSAVVDTSGNLFIADENNHRIREVLVSTGKITTFAGSGAAGFSGDGGSGLGVAITATVPSGAPTTLPVTIGTRVNQSSWNIYNYTTPNTGPTMGFSIAQTASEVPNSRMAQDTLFAVASSNSSVFTVPANLTIPNNTTLITANATTVGGGLAQIIAQQSNGIAQGTTPDITIQAVISGPPSPPNGPKGAVTPVALSGRNLFTATGVTGPEGITGAITSPVPPSGTSLNININVPPTATSGDKILTLQVPGGNVTFTFHVN